MAVLATIYAIGHSSRPRDVYVGQTIDIGRRHKQHRRAAKTHNTFLYAWWRKRVSETGVEPFLRVLGQRKFADAASAKAWLDETERQAIAWVRAHPEARCLNGTDGGDGMSNPSLVTRLKISIANKARPPASLVTRLRMAIANQARRGRPLPLVWYLKHAIASQARKGRPLPPEQKERLASLSRDRAAAITHCPAGHEYTPENTSRGRGRRQCRACLRERANARYANDPGYRERAIERTRARYATDPEYRDRRKECARQRRQAAHKP